MDPYLGEIRMFAGNYAPVGWMICDGSLLSIAENDVLFSLIGTGYGGDGQTTFALPDLRGRAPIHFGTRITDGVSYTLASTGGSETAQLTSATMPSHNHVLMVSADAGQTYEPGSGVVPAATSAPVYFNNSANEVGTMASQSTTSIGGGQPFNIMMPYLAINFIIAISGIYPPRA